MGMRIGAYGLFWQRDLVDFERRSWRLLGRVGENRGTIRIVDFRRARGVYVLYDDIGVYYVGLSSGANGVGGRIRDHLGDEHADYWTRFSWFSFDAPAGEPSADGVYVTAPDEALQMDAPIAVRDLEALLQIAMQPYANRNQTRFSSKAREWIQVADRIPEVQTFETYRPRLR